MAVAVPLTGELGSLSTVDDYEGAHPAVTLCDRQGRAILDLPVVSCRYEESVDGVGAADVSFPQAAVAHLSLRPWNYVVVIADHDTGRWCGPVVGVVFRRKGEASQLRAQGFKSYLEHRMVPDLTFTGQAQAFIAASLIGLGKPSGYPFDTARLVGDGVTRDRTYYAYERAPAAQRLAELAEVEQGYKCRIVPIAAGALWTWSAIPVNWLAAPLTLVHGGQGVQILDVSLDGTTQTTQATATGEGQQDSQLAATVTDATSETLYPRLESVIARQGVVVTSTLTTYAQGVVDAHKEASVTAVVSISGDAVYPTIGQIITLDVAQLDRRQDMVLVGRTVAWEPGGPLVQSLQLVPLTEVERWRTR